MMFILVTPQHKIYTATGTEWQTVGHTVLLNVAHIVSVTSNRARASIHMITGECYDVPHDEIAALPRLEPKP